MLKVAPSKTKKSTITKKPTKGQPTVDEFLSKRDYTGALTLLEFKLKCQDGDTKDLLMWIGYCAFNLGNFRRAENAYRQLIDMYADSPEFHLYLACCYFYQEAYEDALIEIEKSPNTSLKNRLLFNIYHRTGDEKKLLAHHQFLKDTKEDQLSLAAVHYLRGHYQEATDIYKRLLLENREDLAHNVYVAMCYYKLDYYDVSLEILAAYLQAYPDSCIAVNLKACNHFRLYNGKTAENELKTLHEKGINIQNNELIKHNLVVFNNGEHALQVLPGLMDMIPEARLNMVIYHLKRDNVTDAFELIKDIEPSTPQEYIIKGVVYATLGQQNANVEYLKIAQKCFELVGNSPHECDTIPGRQCMASCFYLMRQFDDVLIYMNSIKAYMYNDDDFNYNYGITLAATRNYKGGEEALLQVKNEKYKIEFSYVSWLAKCYIMNGNPRSAWEMYMKTTSSQESFHLVQMIANDCYKMGHFLYAAKAFDVLERLDADQDNWEGKRGACIGVFQLFIAQSQHTSSTTGNTSPNHLHTQIKVEDLQEAVNMLRNTSNPQVEYMTRIIKKYCKENNIKIN